MISVDVDENCLYRMVDGIGMRFGPAGYPPGSKTPVTKLITKTVEKDNDSSNGVKTGDMSQPGLWITIMAVSGLILLVLAVMSIRRDRKEAGSSEND